MRYHLLLFLAGLLIATTANAESTVKLHGKITNPISDSISVRYSESWVGYEPVTIGAKLNKDGTFSLSFPLKYKYTFVTILHGTQGTEIAPTPGDDLFLTLDGNNFDSTLHYTGKGAEVANFMAAHMLTRSFSYVFGSRLQGASAGDPDSFYAKSHRSLQIEMDFLAAHGAGLPESFKDYWKKNFQYELYVGTLNYPMFHEVQKQHTYSISKFDSADFIPVQAVPAAFDDAFLDNAGYRRYITQYYYEQLNAQARLKGLTLSNDNCEDLALVIKNMPRRSAEVFEASQIYMYMKVYTYPELYTKLTAFKKRYPKSEYLSLLDEKLAFKKKISTGNMAMDFDINTVDGKHMKLSDLKGKVVYVDFWASWCGPCMGEMPYAKKIEEKYKGKDVIFLYVSIDADEASWKKKMNELQLDGIHMRDGDGGWNGTVATMYGVQGVPSYFLIDKKGQYAVDATPRPSATDDLTADIDKLLE